MNKIFLLFSLLLTSLIFSRNEIEVFQFVGNNGLDFNSEPPIVLKGTLAKQSIPKIKFHLI